MFKQALEIQRIASKIFNNNKTTLTISISGNQRKNSVYAITANPLKSFLQPITEQEGYLSSVADTELIFIICGFYEEMKQHGCTVLPYASDWNCSRTRRGV